MNSTPSATRLDRVFSPASVAVIGASSSFGKWGQLIASNIVAGGFQGRIYPVNPREENICGLPVFRDIRDVPGPVDLAFITTPAPTVPAILNACADKGIAGIVLITSGFSETDDAGKQLEREVVRICGARGMALIGPNTMGMISPYERLFATGSHTRPRAGSVAFVSQSGNLGLQLIHWAEQQGIGVSLFVGSGNEAALSCTDYLEFLEGDPRTRIIILYLESVKDGRRFFRTAGRINLKKPVIFLKGGRTQAGRTAAASHTGAMGGEDRMFSAACRQAGLLDAGVPSELLDLSAGFSSVPLPRGNRVGIVTLGGGWGVVTADECNDNGLQVPQVPARIVEAIGKFLPPFWSKGNPVDLVGSTDPYVPLVAVEELLKWDGIDAVISLGIVGRLEMARLLADSTRRADPSVSPDFLEQIEDLVKGYERDYIAKLVEFMETYEKPVIGVSLTNTNEKTVRPVEGRRYSGVFYQTPENAVRVLSRMVAYQNFLQSHG